MTFRIFINYRRDDISGDAMAILNRLQRDLTGDVEIFMDVEGIALGEDFIKILQEKVAKCDVLLALIGPEWLDIRDDLGKRRLDNADDFVRVEIETALSRGIPIIPIVFDGAKIPKKHELPDALTRFASYNGLYVHYTSFRRDVDALVEELRKRIPAPLPGAGNSEIEKPRSGEQKTQVTWRMFRPNRAVILAALVTVAAAILLLTYSKRVGWLDRRDNQVLDQRWLKADSKGMHALRAFATQASLARIATTSASNDWDRQLLAIRVGSVTKRFLLIYLCAVDSNQIGVEGKMACPNYDTAMNEYSSGLFDLAMAVLPISDKGKLATTAATINMSNFVNLLNELLRIEQDARKDGGTAGSLYRDQIGIEVQAWLATPALDDRSPLVRVNEADIAALREVYLRGNDDVPAWISAIAELRNRGLQPLADPKMFKELADRIHYSCHLITKDPSVVPICQTNLPKIPSAPAVVLDNPAKSATGDSNDPPATRPSSKP